MFFANKKTPGGQPPPNTLEQYARTVENIILQMGIEPSQTRLNTEQGFGWSFRRGSAIIEIYVSEHDGGGYMQVLSPILHLPQTGLLPLYRRLLELNLQLSNVAIGVFYDVVYLFHERSLDGLDATEANEIITLIAGYADEMDNQLVNEFGGRLYSQT